MQTSSRSSMLRIFFVSMLLTACVAILVSFVVGMSFLWVFFILVILEITFSFDNAIINSKVLGKLSPFWQRLFLTVGIVIAVFLVRFVLPIIFVMIASQHTFSSVLDLALNHPKTYASVLSTAMPLIDAFGGSFLLMIGLYYFLDRKKDIHWLGSFEAWLSQVGQIRFVNMLIMLAVALVLALTVEPTYRETVLFSSLTAILTHSGLHALNQFFSKNTPAGKYLVGGAAALSFLYLNILDASFSLDGVVGAFAITTNVVLIMAGLGVGALWVRSLTMYFVQHKTLQHYRYLDHGAHWAILALSMVMLAKLYHVETPEWLAGSVGLIFIVTAIISSTIERRIHRHTVHHR